MSSAQFRGIDPKYLSEGGGEIAVIGKAIFLCKQVKAFGGMIQHVFSSVEETQAFDVLMEGHASLLFEEAAEVKR